MDNLEKVVQFLQCSEYDIDSIWECVIYYILIDIEVMGRSVLQTHKEESIKSYTSENIKAMLEIYHKQHPNYGNMITSQKFYDGLRLCKKFDSRVNIEEAGDSEQKLEYRNVSFPKKLEKVLLEICFCQKIVEIKGNNTKKLSLYEVLNAVLEKLSSLEMSKNISNRKLLTDWVNNIDFSYNVLAEGAKSLYLVDLSNRVDLELVENWNYYTGHLIINCIWTALVNEENKFFILASNPRVSKEQKEQLDKALYWSIEEIINLTQYFSFTETAFIAEQLYSCVGMLAAKAAKDKDVTAVIEIFNSLAISLQAMQIDKIYEYWKKLADGIKNDKLKIFMEEALSKDVYYREFFVRDYAKIDEEKLGGVRGRNSLLYNKIEKAVLFNLYKKRIG